MTSIVPPVDSVAPGLVTRAPAGAFSKSGTVLLGLGLLGLIVSLVMGFGHGEGEEAHGLFNKQFLHSYLVAYSFCLSIVLGAMFFVLIQHLSRAGWSVTVRRVAENVMGAAWVMPVLFIPLAIGAPDLYHHWWHAPAEDAVIAGKSGYLNPTFFYVRAVLYFVIWIGIATWFRRASIRQDETGDPAITLRMARVAAPCMFLFALSLTFAAIDWMMSLDPHWFSTIWGVYYFAGSFMCFMAVLALLLLWLQRGGHLAKAVTTEHYHDVGKLMFAFVVFWTYIAFSQYMLIWYANLPEETMWYQHHLEGNWQRMGEFLMLGHFGIPFVFLMSRHIKRRKATLALAAVFLVAMHWIDMYWVVMPMHSHHGIHFSLLDLTATLGGLGVLLAVVLRNIQNSPLIPERDPRLAESLHFVNH